MLPVTENLTYSRASRLRQVWPKQFPPTPRPQSATSHPGYSEHGHYKDEKEFHAFLPVS